MKKLLLFFLVLTMGLAAMPKTASGEEIVISGFPKGVGFSVDPSYYANFHDVFKRIADTLKADPTLVAFVWGEADAYTYNQNHDAKNPGVATGRADLIVNLLVEDFGCDRQQVLPFSYEHKKKGNEYRGVRIILQRVGFPSEEKTKRDTVIQEIVNNYYNNYYDTTFTDNFGFTISAGASSARYGGLPVVTVGLDWQKHLQLELQGGIALSTDRYLWEKQTLTNRNVLYALALNVYPWDNSLLGFSVGVQGEEDIAKELQRYASRSWQFLLGPRLRIPLSRLFRQSEEPPCLELGGFWTPGNERREGNPRASWDNSQFRVFVSVSKRFGIGGGR